MIKYIYFEKLFFLNYIIIGLKIKCIILIYIIIIMINSINDFLFNIKLFNLKFCF